MIKLLVEEPISRIVYMDIVPYAVAYKYLTKEVITMDTEIEQGDNYDDQVETRKEINALLKLCEPIISAYPYIESCKARHSRDFIHRGLSNYFDIVFIHPQDLTEEEIKQFYFYTIRFSDHPNLHPENGDVEELDLVGMKPKNFEKKIVRFIKTHLSGIQEKISKFELEKYGRILTNIRDV